MRGTKFTNRIYFSKDGNKLIINQDPLPIRLASQNLILKGKMIKRKKTYNKASLQNNRASSLCSINIPPIKPKQNNQSSNNIIKKDCLRIQSRMITYDILSYLKTKCNQTYHRTQSNFMNPYQNKQYHSQSGKIGVPLRRMQTTQSKIRSSEGNIQQKSTDIGGSQISTSNQMIQSTLFSKSQSPFRSKSGRKSVVNSLNLIKVPKVQPKLKLVQTEPKPINKNKPLLLFNHLELKHVKSENYAMIEADSEQLVLINRGKQSLQIASLTKIMTAYVIIKMVEKRNINLKTQFIQVQDFVQQICGTSAELIVGDICNIQQLLYGLLLPSGNDAALVLANWGGLILNKQASKESQYKQNIATFVQEMTKTARQLGLKDTRYGNPHGLPHPDGKSTAYDQCILASICIKVPLLNEIIKTQQYKFFMADSQNNIKQIIWQNTNKLLRRQGFIGLKTGITVTAGPCLISAYEFKHKVYILTVLRSNKISRRFKDTRKILSWALKKLYQGRMNLKQSDLLSQLNQNKPQLDSDNSEQQNEFVYGEQNGSQLSRRIKIITNQL